jgi:hypothetical protein
LNSGNEKHRFSLLRLAWLATSRRRKRTIITVLLLSFVIGSSLTISSTIQQFPAWVSLLSSTSSPSTLLTYQKNSDLIGLLPANSTVPLRDYDSLKQISGVEQVTPLILKDVPTSLSTPNPSLVVGLDVNFWELSLGLASGHWPEPNSSEAVVTAASGSAKIPSSVTVEDSTFQVVGVAVTSNLVLINSMIISYSTAQNIFGMKGEASLLVSEVSSTVSASAISLEVGQIDSSLATIDLSSSGELLGSIAASIGAISSAIVIAEGIFAFAILCALAVSNIHNRRWEYGVLSTYGGKRSSLRVILAESWLIFALSIIPALLIGFFVLGYFTLYFNSTFGVSLSPLAALEDTIPKIITSTTALNYLGAFIAATLGPLVAIRTVFPKSLANLLSDSHQ